MVVLAGGDQRDAGPAHTDGEGEVEGGRGRGSAESGAAAAGRTQVLAAVVADEEVDEEEEGYELEKVGDDEGALAHVDAGEGWAGRESRVWIARERTAD